MILITHRDYNCSDDIIVNYYVTIVL